MSFLFPAFLLGGLAIAVPIVLHLLRRDVAPEVPFTRGAAAAPVAGRAIEAAPSARPAAARGPRRGAAAAGRGVRAAVPRRRGPGRSRIVIVASIVVQHGGARGFDRARQLARTAMDEAGAGARRAVAFDERADVSHRRAARRMRATRWIGSRSALAPRDTARSRSRGEVAGGDPGRSS